MHVAIVSLQFPPETAYGGIATQAAIKAAGLARLGHEVDVVTLSLDGSARQTLRDGVRVWRVPTRSASTDIEGWLAWSAAAAERLRRIHATQRVDVVDFPEYGAEAYAYLRTRSKDDYIPTVVHLHGPLAMLSETIGWPEPASDLFTIGRAMEGSCLRLADRVISSSACSARWVASAYGLHFDDIPIWHGGVDVQVMRPLEVRRAAAPTIAFVGRVTPSKGVDTLVAACVRLAGRAPGLRVRLIGDVAEDFAAHLRKLAAAGGCDGMLDFRGPIAGPALAEELAHADVFCAPSRYEGGPGLVYLEAMACGLPVVATNVGGIPDEVEHGTTGLLVPRDDAEALAGALHTLLSNPDLRRRIGEAGRRHVTTAADAGRRILELESFYQQTAAAVGSLR